MCAEMSFCIGADGKCPGTARETTWKSCQMISSKFQEGGDEGLLISVGHTFHIIMSIHVCS